MYVKSCPSVGLTPTRVGTARSLGTSDTSVRVHPHASGDSLAMYSANPTRGGSPPREWGQHGRAFRLPGFLWFTPTRVGTAPVPWPPAAWTAVHPHASGDSMCRQETLGIPRVHPPREWGQPGEAAEDAADARFTPTRVGTATVVRSLQPIVKVHPHASGDSPVKSAPRAAGAVHPHASGDSS